MMPRGTITSTYIALCVLALLSTCSVISATHTTNQKIKIQTINYKWVDEEKAEVTACLESEAGGTPFGQVDLLVTNALGRAWRTRGGGALRKTQEGFCFAGISLEKKDLVKTLNFRILENGSDESIQELETFFMVPEVTPMSKDVYEICWDDPEGLAFALAEGGVAQPLVSPPAGCHECCLYLTSRSPGDLVTLETAGTKDSSVRQLVQIRLPENLEQNIPLNITALHKVSRDDDPSGKKQNIKVYLDPHQAIEADDFTLMLTLASNGQQKLYYLFKIIDDYATELEFDGHFQDSTAVIIKAHKGNDIVGFGSVIQNLTDPGSRVAKVGDSSAPSLRVDPGARDQVDVPDKTPCAGGSGPCYYVDQTAPLPPLCDDLPEITFCDAVVSEVQNPPKAPALELRNRQELRVQQPRPDGARTEVVVSRDDSIMSPDGFGCDDLGDGICSQPVAVADDLDGFDVTLVVLDGDGYVTASLAVPFEVHKVSAVALTPSLLKVEVDPRSGGTYEVTLPGPSPSPAATQECQAGPPCRVWFAGVEAPSSVSVRKESNTIYEDITTETPPPTSQVQVITSMDAETQTRVEVQSSNTVTQVELVTFASNVATEDDCEDLEAVAGNSEYYFDASVRGPGGWDFVFAGYCDDGALCEVGQVSVILLDMDSRLGVVGAALGSPDASVRVDVGSLDDVSVEGVGSCAKPDSPCYFLTEPLTAGTLRHCVTIANSAGSGSNDVSQCDTSYTPFKEMTETPRLELIDGMSLRVTLSAPPPGTLEVVVFNPETDGLLSGANPECIPEPDGSCSQEVSIPQELQDFEVLVVAVDEGGDVRESVLAAFNDLKVSTRQLTDDMLQVSWTTSQPEDYSVSLLSPVLSSPSPYYSSPSPSSSSSSPSPSSSSPSSSSTFPSPSSAPLPFLSPLSSVTEIKRTCTGSHCRVHFAHLVQGETYTVQVHRVGDDKVSVGATAAMNTPAEDLPSKCPVTSITAISSNTTQLGVNFNAFEATSAYLDLRLEGEAKELGWEAVRVQGSPTDTFEVTHEGQHLPVGQKVLLVFSAVDDNASKYCVGETVVTLQALDARLSWVGTEYDPEESSLRVDTGSLEEVVVHEGAVCKKEKSPCYFLRDKLPDTIPRCATVNSEDGQKISQCEVYVSPYQVLPETPILDLYDLKEIRLTSSTAFPRAELVVFRLDTNDILSPDDYACTEGRAKSCSQQVAIPDDLEMFGVVVVMLDEEDDVKGSLALPFQVYKADVDQLSLDVFRVSLGSSNPAGSYVIKLNGEASVQCEDNTPGEPLCQAFFCRVKETDKVTIKKTADTNSVTYPVVHGETPTKSVIRSVTSLSQSPSGEVRVRVTSSSGVQRAEYITFASNVAKTSEGYDLANTTSEYSLDVPSHGEGQWDFVVLGYDEYGTLLEVGQAYVAIQALDAKVDEVWKEDATTSFRLATGTQQEVVLEGAGSCQSTESPCYFLEVSKEPVARAHCIDIVNNAEGEGEKAPVMQQCDDSTGAFNFLPETPILDLYDLKEIRLTSSTAFPRAELVVFRLDTNDILSPNDYACTEGRAKSCSQQVAIPDDLEMFGVVVVMLDEEDDVKGSLALPFQVYKADVDQLSLDVFRVSLGSSNPAGSYVIKLNGEASVQCEDNTPGEPLCQAFFCRVKETDKVTIKKTADTNSVTYPVVHGETPEKSVIRSVTSLSHSPSGEVRVRVTSSSGVQRAEYITFASNVAKTSEGYDLANTTSEYSLDVPSHGEGQWDFVVLGYDEYGTLLEVGQAYVAIQALDAKVDEVWKEDATTSFRLATGMQQEVVLEDAGSCQSTESPCYFLEVSKEPVVRAHCIDIVNNAEGEGEKAPVMQQCDDSTGAFNSLPGVFNLTQEGDDKMVVTGDFPSNAAVEITIYDPDVPTDILSLGVASCEEKEEGRKKKEMEEKEEGKEVAFRSSRICSQGFRSPKDSRSLRVLVVALDADGAAVEGGRLLDLNYTEVGTAVWVIVVSVLVSLLVVALVGFGIVFIVKKKKKEKNYDENSSVSEGRYQNSLL
ncbi:uncharacterized protein LOC125027982 isoform X2 [Penaeus chinensis]|uniref:uncharacterized protein LOC125027982 isoform X2 n=1 Tax=Penaeus chinensis TaxID=139456 RepID=UPI001FB59B82|nr:uncharacterized protein LOC125027982 isoform X2 [Penaeus chinensis]